VSELENESLRDAIARLRRQTTGRQALEANGRSLQERFEHTSLVPLSSDS